MIERAQGLVLKTRPLTETSLIVHWLTPTAGRLSTVAKGARRPNSPFRGRVDLYYQAEFSFTRSRKSDLHTLAEVTLLETREALRRDLGHLHQAAYCAALIELTTERDTPLPGIYEIMRGFLDTLPFAAPNPKTVFAFELKLLRELGLGPDADEARLSPGARQVLARLSTLDWELIRRLQLTGNQVLELTRFLHGFLIYHCERLPRGREHALHPPA
jgi:DNA repair protein RecO (recombination protein O)